MPEYVVFSSCPLPVQDTVMKGKEKHNTVATNRNGDTFFVLDETFFAGVESKSLVFLEFEESEEDEDTIPATEAKIPIRES